MALEVEEVDVVDIRKELFVIHSSFHHAAYISEGFVLQFIEEEQTFGISSANRLPPYLHKVSGILRLLPVLQVLEIVKKGFIFEIVVVREP